MTHTITEITRQELRSMLYDITNTTIVSVVSAVQPRMNAKAKDGTPNPFKAGRTLKDGFILTKVNKQNGLIGGKADEIGNLYHRMVNNALRTTIIEQRATANLPPLDDTAMQAEIESRFERGDVWFRHLIRPDGTHTSLVVHKDSDDDGEAYLRFIFKAKGTAEYLSLRNGAMIDWQAVEPFLVPPSGNKNQGLPEGEEIRFIVLALASILEISLNGERYRIRDNFEAMQSACRSKAEAIAGEYLEQVRRMQAV